MMIEDDDFLDDLNQQDEQAEPQEEVKPEKAKEEPEVEEQPAEPEEKPVTIDVKAPESGFVPLGAVLDERDKRKKLEAELEEYRRQKQTAPEPVKLPDMFEDPEGYNSALTQQFEQRLYQQNLQMSERFARNQYGDEATTTALQWAAAKCDQDPYFNAQVKASGDPVGHAVREYQRNQIVESVTPDDFKQFVAWKEAQAGLQQQEPTQATQSPARPPKSLASAPSAGNAMADVLQSDDEIFAETFARK